MHWCAVCAVCGVCGVGYAGAVCGVRCVRYAVCGVRCAACGARRARTPIYYEVEPATPHVGAARAPSAAVEGWRPSL